MNAEAERDGCEETEKGALQRTQRSAQSQRHDACHLGGSVARANSRKREKHRGMTAGNQEWNFNTELKSIRA